MRQYNFSELSKDDIARLLKRPSIKVEESFEVVKPILNDIKLNGLKAAIKYIKQFDGFVGGDLFVTPQEFDEAKKNISSEVKNAIDEAYRNIEKFHKEQSPENYEIETMPGIKCSREYRAIENVGLYIPGGSAVLPSTMLMLGVPAKIAGCKRIVACSPTKEKINDAVLYAALLCGVNEFYKIGGAQAIGLMAFGDESISKVEKIFGPGNQYVTAAKMLVSIDETGCAIDMPAGPSEVLVIADESSNPKFIAADLLSQAEHGTDSQVILLSTGQKIISSVLDEIEIQLKVLPRKELAEKSLSSSFAIYCKDLESSFSFSNRYAPEHLILHIKNSEEFKNKIINAGSVFLGEYSPESAGDYASGTNHSLPTYGYAKSFGGVSVESFMKSISFQYLTKDGLRNISKTVETLAETEELFAHKNAVAIRLKDWKD